MFEETRAMRNIELLGKGLDAVSLRHRVLSDNIANVNTPGFKRGTVEFEEKLRAAMNCGQGTKLRGALTHARHIPIPCNPDYSRIRPQTVRHGDTLFRNDKSNVDLDVEMTDLGKNEMAYELYATTLADKFSGIRDLISRATSV